MTGGQERERSSEEGELCSQACFHDYVFCAGCVCLSEGARETQNDKDKKKKQRENEGGGDGMPGLES